VLAVVTPTTAAETKERTALAFNTAADNFDNSALGFGIILDERPLINYLCKPARKFWTFVAVRERQRFPRAKQSDRQD
jgi:hypothetical protein